MMPSSTSQTDPRRRRSDGATSGGRDAAPTAAVGAVRQHGAATGSKVENATTDIKARDVTDSFTARDAMDALQADCGKPQRAADDNETDLRSHQTSTGSKAAASFGSITATLNAATPADADATNSKTDASDATARKNFKRSSHTQSQWDGAEEEGCAYAAAQPHDRGSCAAKVDSSTSESNANLSVPSNGFSEVSQDRGVVCLQPGDFEMEKHYYPRCLNAQIHPLVAQFFNLTNERIIQRYSHLNPHISIPALESCLAYVPTYFRWAGSDLFAVANAVGKRQVIVVETNSCPSGQKSMPQLNDWDEHLGYTTVLEACLVERLAEAPPKNEGGLAVLYDKNLMEASGYATVLADILKENVYLVPFFDNDLDPFAKWMDDGFMHIRLPGSRQYFPIRAVFRYVTVAPWKRIPVCRRRTLVINPIVACLAGGRNKMMAARAYELYNAEIAGTGLEIRTPETIRDISKNEVPLWVESWGGHAVVKVPYSNAGQGVYTITNSEELKHFMSIDHHYDKFIVQSLVGNSSWSSSTREGLQYHLGSIPDKKGRNFVFDVRCMVTSGESAKGFRPVAMYARRARKPLVKLLEPNSSTTSWEILGTNLSIKEANGHYSSDTSRLLLMDRKDFNILGISLDDLIEGYVQTVLSVIAIDKLATRLMNSETGQFDSNLFRVLNADNVLNSEIMQ